MAGFKACRSGTLTTEGVIPPVNWHPSLSAQVSVALNSLAQCHSGTTGATLIKHTVLKVRIGRHHCMTRLEDSWEKNDEFLLIVHKTDVMCHKNSSVKQLNAMNRCAGIKAFNRAE